MHERSLYDVSAAILAPRIQTHIIREQFTLVTKFVTAHRYSVSSRLTLSRTQK